MRWGGSCNPAESGLDITPLESGKHARVRDAATWDTCAPVRAALVQLRVANGVKWGRGREEVEAQERQKRCLSVPCPLEVVPSWGWEGAGGHRTTDFQVAPAQLEVRRAEPPKGGYPAVPSAGEMPVMPRTAWCARSSQGRQEAKQRP